MVAIITTDDLPTAVAANELAAVMVAGANARATRVAPCLAWADEDVDHPAPTVDQLAEAKLVLIGAVKRWAEAGSGAVVQQAAGPFSQAVDTRQRTGFNLWPSDIESLQAICATGGEVRGIFSVDTAPLGGEHLPWCSINFGALYCSCGYDIAGEPIFELG